MGKKDKILYSVLGIKTILALIISYSILAKGDGGALIHALGSFLINGNVIMGAIEFLIIAIACILVLLIITFNTFPKGLQRNLFVQSIGLDVFLFIFVSYYGLQLWTGSLNMPFEDAIGKIFINTIGMGILFLFISLAIILPYITMTMKKKD